MKVGGTFSETRGSRVGLYATDSSGTAFAIGVSPLVRPVPDTAAEGILSSTDLLSKRQLPITEQLGARLWEFHPTKIASPSALIGLGVRRVRSQDELVPGEIVAIRGAAKLCSPAMSHPMIVQDLIEVLFHESRQFQNQPEEALPPLARDDLGALVVSAYGDAVGLVVGGNGYRAAIALVGPFLAKETLQLVDPLEYRARARPELQHARLAHDVMLLFDDLATTPKSPLCELLEDAA